MRTMMHTGIVGMALMMAGLSSGVRDAVADQTSQPLEGLRVAIVTGEGFQDQEALMPLAFLENRGAEVTVVGPETGEVKAYNSDIRLIVQADAADVSADDFDALVLPGGKAPASIRENARVVALVRGMFKAGKPVAAICHGPQVLVTADVLDGRTMTAYSGVAEELRSAGATYKDQPMIQDQNLITSRVPKDIPEWLAAMEDLFGKAAAAR